MITIKFATKLRGFFRHLMFSKLIDFEIVNEGNPIYEVPNRLSKIKSKLVRSRLADILGIVQQIKVRDISENQIYGSFNRFLDSDIPYFIYVENPTALYHYTLNRNKTYLGRRTIRKLMNEKNLRGIVFMSKECQKTFPELVMPPAPHTMSAQIYPLVPSNPFVDEDAIKNRGKSKTIRFLYIAQVSRFQSKGGLEIIEAFKRLKSEGKSVELTIVTNLEGLGRDNIENYGNIQGLTLCDFKFSFEEMQKLYSRHDVLLQPTSDDSFGLTILEALHAGLAFVTSNLYSIPEIVRDNINGFLVEPHHWFFNPDGMPNPDVWNHRKQTIYSGKISERLVNDLVDRMSILADDRKLAVQFGLESYRMSLNPPFSEAYIANQWNQFISGIKEGNQDKI